MSNGEQIRRRDEALESVTAKNVSLDSKFLAPAGNVEELLKKDTIGLVSLHDFQARRELLEKTAVEEHEKREQKLRDERKQQNEKVLKRPNHAKLSFNEELDGEEAEEVEFANVVSNPAHLKRARLGTDPTVDSSFLPDRERDAQEKIERERLKQEWKLQQEAIKREKIWVTYSYWDGQGHRRSIECTKGTTIGRFLSRVQQEFPQLRTVGADELIFVKEDLMIPHHYSFYDFIVTKARGKSGPLFDFSVKQDVRWVADASKEKEDTHAAKVVERRWFERNKHIFPASRWETYDSSKKYDQYSIHGREIR